MSNEKKCLTCKKTLIVGEKILCKRCGDNAKDIVGKILGGLLFVSLIFGGKKIADNMSSDSIDLDEEEDDDEDDE